MKTIHVQNAADVKQTNNEIIGSLIKKHTEFTMYAVI